QLNEGRAARRIAAAIGTQHQEVLLTEQEFVEGLDAALDSLDQPTFDGLNSYYIFARRPESRIHRSPGGDGRRRALRGLSLVPRTPRGAPMGAAAALATEEAADGSRPSDSGSPAAGFGSHSSADTLGQTASHGATRRGSAHALPARVCHLPAGLPARAVGRLSRQPPRRPAPRYARPPSAGDCVPIHALGDQRDGATAVSRRAPPARQRRRQHGGFHRAAAAARRPGAVQRARSCRRRDALYAAGKKSLLRRIALRGLDPKLFERPKAGFVLPFDRWIRKGLFKAMDRTLCDPEAVRAAGLAPEPVY